MQRVELYDTTLRDGTQAEGISISVDDKLAIAQRLDALGVHYIEGGYAGANPKDDEFFRRAQGLKLRNSVLVAFGNTRRANVPAESDGSISALLAAKTSVVTLVGKASEMQVTRVLETSLEENLAMIADSVRVLRKNGRRVFFDAEHFFDGYRANPSYAVQAVKVAAEAGAECVILCDTNGGTLPDEVAAILAKVKPQLQVRLGIHAHNDADAAV
ncbi:MAG: citramalate synthase, partial [Chloroflexi bacterium]|nr:citramalate synthase [Chloroflexota bacterium]